MCTPIPNWLNSLSLFGGDDPRSEAVFSAVCCFVFSTLLSQTPCTHDTFVWPGQRGPCYPTSSLSVSSSSWGVNTNTVKVNFVGTGSLMYTIFFVIIEINNEMFKGFLALKAIVFWIETTALLFFKLKATLKQFKVSFHLICETTLNRMPRRGSYCHSRYYRWHANIVSGFYSGRISLCCPCICGQCIAVCILVE